MEAEPDVLAASVESTSEKKVWPELALREESVGLKSALNPLGISPHTSYVPAGAHLPTAELPATTPAGTTSSLLGHFLPSQTSKLQESGKPSPTTLPGGDIRTMTVIQDN